MKNLYFLFIALVTLGVANAQDYPLYQGTFDGTVYKQTFEFPTGSQSWAGFSNDNSNIYPLSFPNGGKVVFTAEAASDAVVYFRFEANPYPAVDPAVETADVSVLAANNGTANNVYEVAIPASATNTYNSALFYIRTNDVVVEMSNVKIVTYDTDGTTALETDYPLYQGTFDGTVYKQTFEFPTGSQSWAGFSNDNSNIYPLSFPNGGTVKFTAEAASDAVVYFRFEANPYPAVDPAVETADVSILAANNGTANNVYEVAIPASATNTYNSALFYIRTNDVVVEMSNVQITATTTQSIDDVSMSFSVYPNPAKNTLNVSAATAIDQVSIFDLTGRRVLQATPKAASFSLNVADLNKGMYLVSLKVGDKEMTTKLVK